MKKASRPPLDRLERTIAARAASPNEKSYTSQLLAGGIPKIGAKVTEEAAEVVEAAAEPGDEGRQHFLREVGDLVYHLIVLMRYRECTLMDLEGELARRFGVSGLAEKAARKPATPTKTIAAPRRKTTRKPTKKKSPTPRKKKAKAKR